jgi:hypothetical protein
LREVKSKADAFADSGRPPVDSQIQDPLGAISAELGELVSAPGEGPTPPGGGGGARGGGGGSRSRVSIQIVGDGAIADIDGRPAYLLPFAIGGRIEGRGYRVVATPKVLVAGGGTENDLPEGESEPEIIGWSRKDGKMIETQDLKLNEVSFGEWKLHVAIPGEAMIGVSLVVRDDGRDG